MAQLVFKHGREIGKSPRHYYVWAPCPVCQCGRWVEKHRYEKSPYQPCIQCLRERRSEKFRRLAVERRVCLSKGQIQGLALIANGYSNKQIAQKLGLSLHTVKGRNTVIFRKLGVDNRVAAAIVAVKRLGYLTPKIY